ncbi:N-acetylmuramoyl-L-alanine amidase [Bacteroidia bacterium]|nr:N-acetylmuramoyl-L-alanine amidase [Bacteroidia bacterium]GHT71847.1 N-acetylmuramoyl-L-alanine amidase [Bacteroidia bacterium]GHU87620.1 N-acetylmuramoyl-L-alanine amidase [Bacteroidia bacterium]GHV21957.1 N-acetylmuramoyl-L-alanine amidase [Bacteroidia bacterium]
MKVYSSLVLTVLLLVSGGLYAQKKLVSYVNYAGKYGDLAVGHMNKYKIPASIILGQGLLESGAGLSELARASNNHFGIKCHSDWRGDKVYRKDDGPNDCFRKYNKVEDSYEDHSQFLLRKRYSQLFELDVKDYRGWAKGLQECGYATDKAYANKLIKLIEDYELYRYDSGKAGISNSGKDSRKIERSRRERNIFKTHGLIYVEAGLNDNFDAIAYDMGFKVKDLIKYNEVPEDFPLSPGDKVYLQKKKKKADKPYYEHMVKVGESMHSISQKYGIQLSRLYKMNKKADDYVPEEGDVLRLR